MKLNAVFFWRKAVVHRRLSDNGSSFADLSNDLLFEIFDYLSYNEILFSFGSLNSSFDQLIDHYPHNIHLQFDVHSPTYIRSLKITTTNQLSFFFSFQVSQFASLRAITICNLRTEHVINVLNIIPSDQMEYIYLGVCAFDSRNHHLQMVSTIQTKILALAQYRLRQIRLKERFSVHIADLPERLDALEDLQLVACSNFFLLSEVLSRAPNLKSLHVSTMCIHQTPLIGNAFSLTSFRIRPHSNCTVEELNLFFRQCCPEVRILCVELYIYPGCQCGLLVNKDRWMKIFPPRLELFHLKSLSNSSVHLVKLCNERRKPPLRETLPLTFGAIQEHRCQILIDGPFVEIWNKT